MKRKPLFLVILSFLIFIPFISHSNAQTYKVERVVDGDTLLLTNREKVRLIGVDTPETKHPQKPVQRFGKEAYLFTKEWQKGKRLGLNMTRPGETDMAVSLPMSIFWMAPS